MSMLDAKKDWAYLSGYTIPYLNVTDYVNHFIPQNKKLLIFRQNDFQRFSKHQYIRHLDPRLLPFYEMSDIVAGVSYLRNLDIEYILVPNYLPPTYYNSLIYKITGDPIFSEVLYEHRQARLYKLRSPSEINQLAQNQPKALNIDSWFYSKNESSYRFFKQPPYNITFQTNRDNTHLVTLPNSLIAPTTPNKHDWLSYNSAIQLNSGHLYMLEATIEAKGIIKLEKWSYEGVSSRKTREIIWRSALNGTPKKIIYQFYTHANVDKVQFVITFDTVGKAKLHHFQLHDYGRYERFITSPYNEMTDTVKQTTFWNLHTIEKKLQLEDKRFYGQENNDKSHSLYFFSGPGSVRNSNTFFEDSYCLKGKLGCADYFGETLKIDLILYGQGEAELLVYAFPENESSRVLLSRRRYLLTGEPLLTSTIIDLPNNTREYRLVLKSPNNFSYLRRYREIVNSLSGEQSQDISALTLPASSLYATVPRVEKYEKTKAILQAIPQQEIHSFNYRNHDYYGSDNIHKNQDIWFYFGDGGIDILPAHCRPPLCPAKTPTVEEETTFTIPVIGNSEFELYLIKYDAGIPSYHFLGKYKSSYETTTIKANTMIPLMTNQYRLAVKVLRGRPNVISKHITWTNKNQVDFKANFTDGKFLYLGNFSID